MVYRHIQNTRALIWEIFLLAFLIRLIVVVFAVKNGSIQSWEYESIANNILDDLGYRVEHLGITHYVFGPPLYPLLTALIYAVTNHSQLALVLLQVFLSAIACTVIFTIGREMFNYTVGIIASFLVIFHPGILVYVTKLHSLNIDVLLLALVVLITLKAKNNMKMVYFVLLGSVFGLCMLSRSTIFLFVLSAITFLLCTVKDKKKTLYYSSLTVIIAMLIIFPWLVRNYSLLNSFVFIQKTGEVFWRGNNQNATGTTYTLDKEPIINSAPKEFRERLYHSTEIEQDRLFWRESIKFIKSSPLKFVMLTVRKFYYFWWFSPHFGIEYPKHYLLIYRGLYAAGFLFAIFGVISAFNSRNMRLRGDACLLILFFLSISLLQSLFYIEGRHRWAIEPLILIFSAHGISSLWYRVKGVSWII